MPGRVAGALAAGRRRVHRQGTSASSRSGSAASLGIGQKKPPRLNPQVEREGWRLLASLERLDAGQRVEARRRADGAPAPRPAGTDRGCGRSAGSAPARRSTVRSARSCPPPVAERWIDALLARPLDGQRGGRGPDRSADRRPRARHRGRRPRPRGRCARRRAAFPATPSRPLLESHRAATGSNSPGVRRVARRRDCGMDRIMVAEGRATIHPSELKKALGVVELSDGCVRARSRRRRPGRR